MCCWIDWVTDNAVVVQAFATVILVVVTSLYVSITYRMVNEAKKAVKLNAILYFLGSALDQRVAKRNEVVKVLFPKDKEFEKICQILNGNNHQN